MSGYYGFAMSNNAVSAYLDGEKPLSKWTKAEIISEIEQAAEAEEIELNCTIEDIKKLPIKELKTRCLMRSSWHHTSSRYNKTDFYSVDFNAVEDLNAETIEKIISKARTEAKAKKTTEEKWQCAFLEWSGSRKHPKTTEITEVGTVKNGWFYREDGTKKKTTANGFRFIKKIGV